MATKTLIRSKKKHQVALEQGSQLAQSAHGSDEGTPLPPVAPRKSTTSKRSAPTPAPAPSTKASPVAVKTSTRAKAAPAAPSPPPPPARKRASASTHSAGPNATARGKPDAAVQRPVPRLPARVPADGLWEADSTVMQSLQALVDRNAQLSEQLERLQTFRLPKGDTK